MGWDAGLWDAGLWDADETLRARETWRFDVLDQYGNVTGEVNPSRSSPPTISYAADAAVNRTLQGVRLGVADSASVNRYTDRIRPVRVDGTTETECGVFLWATDSLAHHEWGDTIDGGVLYDQSLILSYGISQTISYDIGRTLTDLLAELIEDAGIADHAIATSRRVLADPVGWPVGTPRKELLDHLLALLGYTAAFDGSGTWVADPLPLPGYDAPDWVYDHGTDSVVVAGSPTTTTDLYRQPNVYLVTSESPAGATILGRYELPDEHPASVGNRGYELTSPVHTLEGLESTAQATEVARADARKAAAAVETVSFVTGPEVHGHMDVVSWMGDDRWQETEWSLTCDVGGLTSHKIEKVVI